VSKEELAYIVLSLQAKGCYNINLVPPNQVVPQILEALELSVELGLHLPLAYNSGGYDSVDTLRILGGIVDIHMPDMKYDDTETARELSGMEDYAEVNKAAIKEMHRQTGDLDIDHEGVSRRGLLVRHLVLPHGLAGKKGIVSFLSEEIGGNTYVNIMDQYHPCYKALQISSLGRRISHAEFQEALSLAWRAGLRRLDGSVPLRFLGCVQNERR
jgi:putative pyruvate formate lyase activating enzyme